MDTYNFTLYKVLSYGMLPVIRRRDILKIRILSRKEKASRKNGSNDIEATTPSGSKYMISRDEILNKYRYLSGNKISFAGLSCSSEYMVYRPDNTQAYASKIPLNCTVDGTDANKNNRSSGDYIVAYLDSDGEIDATTASVIPAAMFKKMFCIPNNVEIDKFRGRPSTREYIKGCSSMDSDELERYMSGSTDSREVNREQPKVPDYTSELKLNTHNFNFGDEDMIAGAKNTGPTQINLGAAKPQQGQEARVVNRIRQPQAQEQAQGRAVGSGKYKYTAIGQLIDQGGNLVGFKLKTLSNGAILKVTLQQMFNACSKHLVDNVTVGTRSDTGRKYFRGVTKTLNELEKFYV